jgi:DNA polymerase-3 subunit delta'
MSTAEPEDPSDAPAAARAPGDVDPRRDPEDLLRRSVASGRIHSAYLLSGPPDATRPAALRFVRALVCTAPDPAARPCEACTACRRSAPREEIALDGTGKSGPLLRHVGDHADLVWVERGADDTRVRIGQIRAVQQALRLRSNEGGFRAAVVADAEWLNQESQNALLRLLEEPPPRTTLLLLAATATGLLATVRSRCQRVAFPTRELRLAGAPDAVREQAARLAGAGSLGIPALLDWAEEFRGARADAAAGVASLLETAALCLRERVAARVAAGEPRVARELDAFREVQACRKALAQRNANPQMVAERALLALHGALR